MFTFNRHLIKTLCNFSLRRMGFPFPQSLKGFHWIYSGLALHYVAALLEFRVELKATLSWFNHFNKSIRRLFKTTYGCLAFRNQGGFREKLKFDP